MTRWHTLAPADADFIASAPHRFVYTLDVPATAERVWTSLQSDASLAAWGHSVRSVTWTSARPFGVGTTREVVLPLGAVQVRERFFRWDEGVGHSFFVAESSAPMLHRFAEDYAITTTPGGARLVWTVAIEAKPRFSVAMRALAPVLRAAFGRAASEGRSYFSSAR